MKFTSKELRNKFFEDNGEFMLEEFKAILHGDQDDFKSKSAYVIKTAYPLLFNIIESASMVDESLAKTSSGIIQMMSEGMINSEQALSLLSVLDSMLKVQSVELDLRIKEQMLEMSKSRDIE